MKKKLIFEKGIHTIKFPCFLPMGLIDFNKHARTEIGKIANKYQTRKNVTWNYTMDWKHQLGEVSVSKFYKP